MARQFTPKIPAAVGQVTFMRLSVAQLVELFANPQFTYRAQRNHEENASKRRHTAKVLSDASLEFFGAYCEELATYVNTDGYHRAFNLTTGNASVAPWDTITLVVRRVKTVEDLDRLYDKYNSSVASKRAADYLASGARKADKMFLMSDPWFKSSANALQMAAGVRGSVSSRDAVLKMSSGLELIHSLRLQRAPHVKSGTRAAMIAIATYATDKKLARFFIEAVCKPSEYSPLKPTLMDKRIMRYRLQLEQGVTPQGGRLQSTGGSAANQAMEMGLYAFYATLVSYRGGKPLSDCESMTLNEFISMMQSMRK